MIINILKSPINLLKVVIFGGIVYSVSSCRKFLDVQEPNSKIPISLAFSDDANANSAVVGMYLDMYFFTNGAFSGGAGSIPWVTGLSADELHNNLQEAIAGEIERNNIEVDNTYTANLWISIYKSVYRANAVMEGVNLSTGVTPAKKNQFKGEALFIRAFCYFYLVNLFGDVPLVLTTDYHLNAKLSRASQMQVYSQIEADLLAADTLLLEDYPTVERVRPNRSTVNALLARLYLFRQDWQKAAGYATKILLQTSRYKFPADLNGVFLANSTEAIWQLQPGDNAYYTNEGYVFGPREALNSNVLTDTLVNSFSASDKRKINWIGSLGSLYRPNKYKLYQLTRPPVMEYSMVFRLAEQYLIRAEANAQLGAISGPNGALSDINAIRNRAGLSDTTVGGLNEVMAVIERERKLELFTEWGHRWLDLKRWNKATEILAPLKPNWLTTDTLYPVPQSEINKNAHLKPQNPGYL
jgi:hypothetical protein